jgi:TonB family protein
VKNATREPVAVPEPLQQPFREIARQCLHVDPRQRCTVGDILGQLRPQAVPSPAHVGTKLEARPSRKRSKRWIVAPIVVAVLLLVAWIGSKLVRHQPPVPAAESRSAQTPAAIPAAQSPAPFAEQGNPAQKRGVGGSVLQQIMPDVSRSALNTVHGRLKVSIQVSVDASGNVTQASFVSAGPSTYFANRALAAARQWKFEPPQIDGHAAASAWVLRFQFRRTSTEVFPAEKNP